MITTPTVKKVTRLKQLISTFERLENVYRERLTHLLAPPCHASRVFDAVNYSVQSRLIQDLFPPVFFLKK